MGDVVDMNAYRAHRAAADTRPHAHEMAAGLEEVAKELGLAGIRMEVVGTSDAKDLLDDLTRRGVPARLRDERDGPIEQI